MAGAGWKQWVSGEEVTATGAQTYWQDQVVNTFASAAARDSAISSPSEGMLALTTDTDTVWIRGASAWIPFGGYGQLTDYSPTLLQNGTVTKTDTYSRYRKAGRWVDFQFLLTVTGTGTGSNPIQVTLPFTAAQAGNLPVGQGWITFSTSYYRGIAVLPDTTHMAFISTDSTVANYMGADVYTAQLTAGLVVAGNDRLRGDVVNWIGWRPPDDVDEFHPSRFASPRPNPDPPRATRLVWGPSPPMADGESWMDRWQRWKAAQPL